MVRPKSDKPGWIERCAELFGTLPDAEVAKVAGVSVGYVKKVRLEKGIHFEAEPPRPWTSDEDALLGKYTDKQVAGVLGRGVGGGAPRPPAPCLGGGGGKGGGVLGKAEDEEVGKRLRGARSAVFTKRNKMGIENPTVPGREWSEAEIRLLGTAADKEIAQKLGRTMHAVRNQRHLRGMSSRFDAADRPWTATEVELLGRLPDAELAVKFGRTLKAIQAKREELRI